MALETKIIYNKFMTKKEFWENAKQGLVNGIFWSIGASIGFAIVTTILVSLMSRAGTLPLLGSFIASIVRSTLQSLGVEVP
jgi:hypothetical protein